MVEAGRAPAYGLVVIDGGEAVLATAQGLGLAVKGSTSCCITEVKRMRGAIHSRTCRGGQSQNRYQRLRDEAELAFLREVRDQVVALLGKAHAFVLAGPADMKRKLRQELPQVVASRVVAVVDVSCGVGMEALRQAAAGAQGVARAEQSHGVREALEQFMQLNSSANITEVLTCYGEEQTLAALRMGAVDCLLLAKDLQGTEHSVQDFKDVAAEHGTEILEVKPLTESAVQFCGAFQIGGCLRWPLCAELLDNEACDEDVPGGFSLGCSKDATTAVSLQENSLGCGESSIDSNAQSTEVECSLDAAPRRELLEWVEIKLASSIEATSAVSALVACVDVVLPEPDDDHDECDAIDAVAGISDMLGGEGVAPELVDSIASHCAAYLSGKFELQL